jgi:soluble lytic murein transglycosylase
MKRTRRWPVLVFAVAAASLVGVAALWLCRDSIRPPEALYAEARHARPARAETLYEVLARRLSEIREYAQLWQAEAAMPELEAFRTLQSLSQYLPNSPVAYLADLRLARYLASIDAASAEDAYLAALTLHESPALRLELARFYEERGDNEEAYGQYRRLLSVKSDAFVGMRRNAKDRLQLAEDFDNATYFANALDVLQGIEEPRASRLRGWADLGLGNYASAAEELDIWLKSEPDSDEDWIRLAQALAGTGQTEEAIAIYASIDTADSRFGHAELLENASPDEAVELYLAVPYPVAWWNATWILESQGRLEEAMSVYARIAASQAYFADDAAYRLFVLGERSGDQAAVSQAREYLEGFGLNWLSQRAGIMATELPMGPSIQLQAPDILSKVHILDSLGREDLADLELLFCAQLRTQLPVRLACLQQLTARGHILEVQAIADESIEDGSTVPQELWQLAFPRPYMETVVSNAEKLDLDPLLIWSIIRVESKYDPNARSVAGASGLMQIIPVTQDWISQQLGLDLAPGDIFVPEVNIQLGAWYLRNLLDQFDGDLELALAAYNGGAVNVQQWLEDPMVSNREDFIRWIGFGETREYLEKVSIAYWIYQQIYSP